MSGMAHARSPLSPVLAVLAALSSLPLAAQPAPKTSQILITGAKVLAPDASKFLDGQAVLIHGTRILMVGRRADLEIDDHCVTYEAAGKFVIPGLIDLHSHLLLHPYDEASWNDQVLKESHALRTIRATVAAKATLDAGFTTLRDLGTEGAGYADVALRDAIRQGIIPGPRIFAATRALVATGCYGPTGFAPHVQVPKGAQVADGPLGVRIAVRQQIAAGADWIKVYADYRRKPGDPSTATYSAEELAAIVDEARSAKVPVAAHASTDAAIRRAVLAGVQTIEHGYFAGDETLALMKKHGVVICPTLTASESMARYAGWKQGRPEPLRIKTARVMFARALRAGVTIACGSDVGVFSHGDNARELELMSKWGMGPVRALQSATTVAAKVLHQEDKLGQIRPGFYADLVVLDGDPLLDISAVRRVRAVIKNGAFARR